MASTSVSATTEEKKSEIEPVLRSIDLQSNFHYLKKEFTLVWLDAQINSSVDCQHARARLRLIASRLKTFVDFDTCLAFLHANENEECQQQICVIVSGSLSNLLVPAAADLAHVTAIAIYCFLSEKYESAVETIHHPKVVGLFVELNRLLIALDARIESLATVTPLTRGTSSQQGRSIQNLSHENAIVIWFHSLIHSVVLLLPIHSRFA